MLIFSSPLAGEENNWGPTQAGRMKWSLPLRVHLLVDVLGESHHRVMRHVG